MSKKLLALVLSLAMMMSLSLLAFGEDDFFEEEIPYEEEIPDEENYNDYEEYYDPDAVTKEGSGVFEEKEPVKQTQSPLEILKAMQEKERLSWEAYLAQVKDLFEFADEKERIKILEEIYNIKKQAKDSTIGIFINGSDVDFSKYDNVKPVVREGRTLVPLRAATESMGAEVGWQETGEITIKTEKITIEMKIDDVNVKVNEEAVVLDVPPTVENGRTLVPIRFIAETFKLKVDWDEASQTVVIEEIK